MNRLMLPLKKGMVNEYERDTLHKRKNDLCTAYA